MRALIAGLFALCSVACADGGSGDRSQTRTLAVDADGGGEPEPCNWFVHWLTMRDVPPVCNYGAVSKDPAVALFRTNGGECLAPVTICGGFSACADLTFVREKQVIEVWGPAGLDDDTVWAATEFYECE